MAVRSIPWKLLMELLRDVRNTFYKKPKPSVKQLVVTDLTVDELDKRLRQEAFFEDVEEYTYKYRGEILNLRRPAGIQDGYQMVIHLRAFEHEDGIEILVHYEISRFAHPRAHLSGPIFSWNEGQLRLETVLQQLGINYKRLDNPT